jgi:hypothetical protein
MRALRVCLVAALAACAGTPAPRPDDMSAAQHRAEAARERDAAQRSLEEHGAKVKLFDHRTPGEYADVLSADEFGPAGPVVGPRGATPDLYVAEARAAHARAHEAAAFELERFESAECEGIPPAERAGCPLLLGAGAVVDVGGGVEIRFFADAPVDEIYRRVRCHFAYARTRGFDDSVTCALYLKGISIERTDPRIIRMTASDPATVVRVRRATREQVPVKR